MVCDAPFEPPNSYMTQCNLFFLPHQIAAQREKVRDVMVLLNLTDSAKDKLLKIWHSKNEIRQKFLGLIEEKEPLTRVCRPGEQTTLGTAGQQKVLESMQRQAKGLKKVLKEYNERIEDYVREFPSRAHPWVIEYGQLMQLEPDDPFWNDGMFTNQNEPWADDPNKQKGIRHLASLNRGIEEKRRIGWEVRRTMRWAVDQHSKLRQIIDAFANTIECPQLAVVLNHPILQSLDETGCITAAKALIHPAYMKVTNNQIIWNDFCNRLVHDTASQLDDQEICTAWSDQIFSLRFPLSQIPGNIDNLINDVENEQDQANHNQRDHSPGHIGEDEEEEGLDDENYRQELEQLVNRDMLDELANEAHNDV
ncbi:hypothetical protein PCASD_14548 [Puccinia coronata f. sp. avenae]|uniref:Uncharacterized protein n=1 Tax=Puccinia coronata f. sp. avenae TaxID=200324 RepID=A0A2N5STU7_9BASI|nr:hypothetical protein PCASD_14548 [Puccinia coronata f. sp. avenae]